MVRECAVVLVRGAFFVITKTLTPFSGAKPFMIMKSGVRERRRVARGHVPDVVPAHGLPCWLGASSRGRSGSWAAVVVWRRRAGARSYTLGSCADGRGRFEARGPASAP